MKNLALVITLVFILFSSCKKDEEQAEPYVSFASKIIGTWNLVSVTNNNTQSTETFPGTLDGTTLQFKNTSEVTINTDCNDGYAHYLVTESGGTIIDDFNLTSAVCLNPAQQWENRLIDGLVNAFDANISGNSLVLTSDGTWSLNFTKN